MVCTYIDHRNDIKIFKTQVEPVIASDCFHCKVIIEHFDVVSMVDKSKDHGNMDSFWRPFLLKFLGKSHAQVKEKQIAPPSHFDRNCQQISARELAQLLLKVLFVISKGVKIQLRIMFNVCCCCSLQLFLCWTIPIVCLLLSCILPQRYSI